MPESPDATRLYAGPFTALEEELLRRLPERFGLSPVRERILLVPSNDLREHLLKRLAARWSGCAAKFSAMTLYDFALRLLKHRGMFPRELPPARMAAALSAAVRETYGGGAGDFASIAGTPGFVPALARTLGDLEEGWIDDGILGRAESAARARGDAARAARWSEWRRLRDAVRRKVGAMGGMTRRRIFQEAVAGFEQPGYPFRVTLYGFYDVTRLQWTLIDALLSSGLLDEVYFPALFDASGSLSPAFGYAAVTWERFLKAFEGNVLRLEDAASREVAAVRGGLFSPAFAAAPEIPPVTVLSAPHEEGEMRQAARTVRGWLDAGPGEEVLLLSRRFEETAVSAWERMASEYGIRTAERLSVPLASVPPVRVLVQMAQAVLEDFPRRKVMDILSSPYRRLAAKEGGPAPRPDLWEVMTRELLVVSGGDWEARLSRPRARSAEEDGREDAEERKVQLALLAAEAGRLKKALRPLAEAAGYAALARSLRSVLLADFQVVLDATPEGERDRRALAALMVLLDDVERIPDRDVPWPGGGEALRWFLALLAEQRLFVGEKGGLRVPGAVVAGDIHTLRGVTADRVLLLSVNDDLMPAQVDEDPLLPDEDRAALNRIARDPGLPEALSLLRRNAAQEKLLFALPAASAREETAFSVLRADEEGSAKRPSRYLLDLLSRAAGPAVFSEEWAGASKARVVFLPRSPAAALRSGGPLSPREEALRNFGLGLPQAGGGGDVPWRLVAGALSGILARREGRSLFPGPGAPGQAPEAWSATQLDLLARCPYRYFLEFQAGISPVEEPEEELALSPAEAGIVVHDILRALGREAIDGSGFGDPQAAAARAVARFARDNPTGLPGLFRIQCRAMVRDIAALVAWEGQRTGADAEMRIRAVEETFRVPAVRGLPAFRGRVDRVDRGPAGEVLVIDYKYRDGEHERPPLDLIAHGLSHQVPVYLAYARTLAPPPPDVRATLLFLRNGVRAVAVGGMQWKAVRDEWAAALLNWLSLVRAGVYPPLPHHLFSYAGAAPPRYCDNCPYKDHCRVSPAFEGPEGEAAALAGRVAGDPALAPVRSHRPARGRAGA